MARNRTTLFERLERRQETMAFTRGNSPMQRISSAQIRNGYAREERVPVTLPVITVGLDRSLLERIDARMRTGA